MSNPRERICPYCKNSFTTTYANERRTYCSQSCAAFANKPSSALLIPEGEPMSKRTEYRRRRAAGLTQAVFRYPFNEAFFDTWSDELAWLLGLIWSDGCLFRNSVEICSIDWQLIDMIAQLIGMENGVRRKNKGKHWRIVFTSKRITQWLKSLGLTEAKSLTITFPTIPDEYIGAFLRGVLDGDGSVTESFYRSGQQCVDISVSWFTASIAFRDGLMSTLKSCGIRAAMRINNDNVWRVYVSHHESLRKLHDLMYHNEGVCSLMRKHVPYHVWMTTPRVRSGRPKNPTAPKPEPPSVF